MCDDKIESDAESIFMPQLLLDLIQRLVERNVLESDDARALVRSSMAKSGECNPSYADAILGLISFCERFAVPRQER